MCCYGVFRRSFSAYSKYSADYALFHQISRNPLHVHYSPCAKELFTIYANLLMDLLSLSSVLVLCVKILSYECYTLMCIDISIFMCLFTFYFMSVYVSLYYHCVLTVIIIKKLLTYLLTYLLTSADHGPLLCFPHFSAGHMCKLTLQ